ncbi:MAG: ATP-dependent RecD-like DNA helicase [Chloroflexi bacterium]|nr:ATP-dependent RecD-like DNA helicase [Chloroflexota bacterium]
MPNQDHKNIMFTTSAKNKSATNIKATGAIHNVTFYNPENGYTVARLAVAQSTPAFLPPAYLSEKTSANGPILTVVGHLLEEPVPGIGLTVTGEMKQHKTYGWQLQIETAQLRQPTSKATIELFLAATIEGIGPALAHDITAHFEGRTFAILDNNIARLQEVKGIGQKKLAAITESWSEIRQWRDALAWFAGMGISPKMTRRIMAAFDSPEEAVARVKHDPYQLIRHVDGIGFNKADDIARQMGLPADAPARIEAGVTHILLNEMTHEGHCFAYEYELIDRATELLIRNDTNLPINASHAQATIRRMTGDQLYLCQFPLADVPSDVQRAVRQVNVQATTVTAVYHNKLFHTEAQVARMLVERIQNPDSQLRELQNDAVYNQSLARILAKTPDMQPTPEQLTAVWGAVANKISVITGGPGVGKTFITRLLIKLLKAHKKKFKLTSPTGKAANVLTEATGQPATTIHRLLEADGRGFGRNEDNPIETDLLIIDETSMLDIWLTNALLRAILTKTHVVFVGDVDQLPSVGPGRILADLIHSGQIHVTRLTHIFRQARGSLIIQNAHRINWGEKIAVSTPYNTNTQTDFFWFERDAPGDILAHTLRVVTTWLPQQGYTMQNIQVLAGMYRGEFGIHNLNSVLQEKLNPPALPLKHEWYTGSFILRVGDRVIQTRNDYGKHIVNGDTGWLRIIQKREDKLYVDMDNGVQAEYTFDEARRDLKLAWAISVHRFQGSAAKVIVFVTGRQHYMMLQRNLLYTAVTRATELAVLIGDSQSVQMSIRRADARRRNSGLRWQMRGLDSL